MLKLLQRAPAAGHADMLAHAPASFVLGAGDKLSDSSIRIRWFGRQDAPVIITLGGISSGRNVCGPGGWWNDMVGPSAAVDTNQYSALGFDFAPGGDEHVRIAPDDQARLIEIALDELGIDSAHALIGASYGGMVGMALAQRASRRLQRLCVISAAHEPSPLGSAWRGVQRRIVEFAMANGQAEEGLSLARQLAMITYRSAEEFETRFERRLGDERVTDLDQYLVARGDAFLKTMPPKRWLSLSEAIDRTNVTPEQIATPTTLVACPSDQLIPFHQMEELAQRLPRLAAFHRLESIHGHDAFLKEPAQLSTIIRSFLGSAPP
jgi:homoserine O-acetyltransferase/O-succinyltransferase